MPCGTFGYRAVPYVQRKQLFGAAAFAASGSQSNPQADACTLKDMLKLSDARNGSRFVRRCS